ncbi:outer envelope pore protein [Trifolium medium]|uniref:Outer envelope pore protein n=1 Tax=Trifolium medium TaxID=97028 RepID=A0A392P2Q2_9FABA|nr:outer envelope pore protein [Trifolium medium]
MKKMCKEGAYWGAIAGVYVGTEYGVERIRGTRDWVILSTVGLTICPTTNSLILIF